MRKPPLGDSGLGKSTLINTLFEHKLYDLAAPRSLANGSSMNGNATGKTVAIESKSAGERSPSADFPNAYSVLSVPSRYRGKRGSPQVDRGGHTWVWRFRQQR